MFRICLLVFPLLFVCAAPGSPNGGVIQSREYRSSDDLSEFAQSYQRYLALKSKTGNSETASKIAWRRLEPEHKTKALVFMLKELEGKYTLSELALREATSAELAAKQIDLDVYDVHQVYRRSRKEKGSFARMLAYASTIAGANHPVPDTGSTVAQDEEPAELSDHSEADLTPELVDLLLSEDVQRKIFLAADYYHDQKKTKGPFVAWRGLSRPDRLRVVFYHMFDLLSKNFPVTYDSLKKPNVDKLKQHHVETDPRDVRRLYTRANDTHKEGFVRMKELATTLIEWQQRKLAGEDPLVVLKRSVNTAKRVPLKLPSDEAIQQFYQTYQTLLAKAQKRQGSLRDAWDALTPEARIGVLLYQGPKIKEAEGFSGAKPRKDGPPKKTKRVADLDEDEVSAFYDRVRRDFPGGYQAFRELFEDPHSLSAMALILIGASFGEPEAKPETRAALDRYGQLVEELNSHEIAWNVLSRHDHFSILSHHYAILRQAGLTRVPTDLSALDDAAIVNVPIHPQDAKLFYGRVETLLANVRKGALNPVQYLGRLVGQGLPLPDRIVLIESEEEAAASDRAAGEWPEALAEAETEPTAGTEIQTELAGRLERDELEIVRAGEGAARISFDPELLQDERYELLKTEEERQAFVISQIHFLFQRKFIPVPVALFEITPEQRQAHQIHFNPPLLLARSYDAFGKKGFAAALKAAGFRYKALIKLDADLRAGKCSNLMSR